MSGHNKWNFLLQLPTLGNSQDFGDSTVAKISKKKVFSKRVRLRGWQDHQPLIQLLIMFTIATLGNATNFGDLYKI